MLLEKFSVLAREKLSSLYDTGEAEAITAVLLMDTLSCNRSELRAKSKLELDAEVEAGLMTGLERLLQGEPVQYVTGMVEFYGLKLRVDPAVLIPRPETEYLVDRIVANDTAKPSRMLDVCTGSGCIALALKSKFPEAEVWGLDVSEAALQTAKRNARENQLQIQFMYSDILSPNLSIPENTSFDLIVSNPPYVLESEQAVMHKNVLEFEPRLALFVPDEDPLKFYKALERIINRHLQKGGVFYAEINEKTGNRIRDFFQDAGYADTRIWQDLNKRDRFVVIRK